MHTLHHVSLLQLYTALCHSRHTVSTKLLTCRSTAMSAIALFFTANFSLLIFSFHYHVVDYAPTL